MSNYAETHPTAGPDFFVRNEGSIFLLSPETPAAEAWLAEYITDEQEHQYFGKSLVVEHRYILDIVDGIRGDGLTVAGS